MESKIKSHILLIRRNVNSVMHPNHHLHHHKHHHKLKSLERLSLTLSIFLFIHIIINNIISTTCLEPFGDNDDSKEVDKCEACRLVVKSFEKGMDETTRGKHEGGDTSWEERNLKSYADSEVRLVEIQEKLCEDVKDRGKAQCLSLAEDTESEVENWWFKQRNKNVRLHDYLCISKLKVCCAEKKYGPNCQPCPSECNGHGICDGAGTRSGSGECLCETGYTGKECDKCADNHFSIATNEHQTCLECDSACKGCYGLGRTNCTECRSGYYKHEVSGCIDMNECESGVDDKGNRLCTDNTYCVNTDGSYRCADCHVSCSGCVGYGPSMCISCSKGYKMDSEYSCQSEEDLEKESQLEREDSMSMDKGSLITRYFFLIGVNVISLLMFRRNFYVTFTWIIGFSIFTLLSDLDWLDEVQNFPITSSE